MSFSHCDNFPFHAAEIIRAAKPNFQPRIALILGSGLGVFADQLDNKTAIPYQDLPGFPVSTVVGHAGELVLGSINGVDVVCMKGRGHFYEGKGMGIMTPAVRTLNF